MLQFRDFERAGRSEALGTSGMIATSHPAATLAGLDALREGGNAVDAAICASAMQAVVEPTQSGLGGDTFALIMRRGDAKPIALNGSGWSPAAASLDWYRDRKIRRIEIESPHAVTVPGTVAAWERLAVDHGRLALDHLLAPAIRAADEGHPIPERLARDWKKQVEKLRRNGEAAALFLFNGAGPKPGAVHRQPALAKTLRQIAKGGARAFYEGEIAHALVARLRASGGLHTVEDFAAFAPEYVEPISVDYRGYRLWECPPNGQGLVPLLMAKVIEGFDLSQWAPVSAERFHLQAEIARMAYAERNLFIGDPRTTNVPVEGLLADAAVAERRRRVAMNRKMKDADPVNLPIHRDTVFIAAVDKDGTAVALISSIFEDFGSGIADLSTGVIFHNRGSSFTLEPGHPNVIAGRKRPMHTIIPAILARRNHPVMSFGVTGAHFQPIGQLQVLTNVIDYGMGVQAAIDQPRMFAMGDTFEVESTVSDDVIGELARRGHKVTRPANPLGTAQAVWIDHEMGVLRGGADGRRDGIALGY